MSHKPINIRELTLTDLQLLHQIESSVHIAPWSENLLKQSLSGDEILFGAFHQQQLLGYVVIKTMLDELELLNIAVSQYSQGQGVASLLLNYLFDFAQEHQLTQVFLEVRHSNISAIKLYQKFDFVEIGCRKNYYSCGDMTQEREDAVLMQKIITST
jgi:[ribosomal protein S18]-alanine N-acetyltransferase